MKYGCAFFHLDETVVRRRRARGVRLTLARMNTVSTYSDLIAALIAGRRSGYSLLVLAILICRCSTA